MLPRSLRLERARFESFRGLLRRSSPHFSISYGNSPHSKGGTGIIVPKKVLKSAVERHQLKRKLRALLRAYSSKSHILIVSARSGANGLSYTDLESELSPLLKDIIGETQHE